MKRQTEGTRVEFATTECKMACVAWFERLSAAVDGELDPVELERLDDHCRVCPGCQASRRRLEDLRRRSLLRISPGDDQMSNAIREGAEARNRRHTERRVLALVCIGLLLAGAAAAGRTLLGRTDGPSPVAQGQDQPVTITAVDDEFEAGSLTVPSGTTIEWKNHGDHTHRLIRQLGGAMVASDLTPGSTETVTFTDSGDYEYYCSIHSGMQGRIRVET